jgi:hypothetical protein
MGRSFWIAAAATTTAAAGVVVWQLRGDDETTDATTAATATAKVTRRDLAVTEDVDGELGYADQRELGVQRSGVITSLAAEGTTIKQGTALYAVNTEPTVLLTGKVPMYRKLSTSSSHGDDVEQLEKALEVLGYGDDLTVDDDFTWATAAAAEVVLPVLDRDDPDGVVEPGDVVFAPGPLRVVSRKVSVGASVGGGAPVLTVSSTGKVVNVDLDVDKSDLVAAGDRVTVALPDGRDTAAKVTSVGTDVQTNAQDPDADPTVPMVVTLTKPKDAAAFDSGGVTVTIVQSRDEGVLAVPVTALLALAEGGYAVQVVDPAQASGYRLVAVKTGTITDEYAGVSGAGITEGLDVVVPA